MLKYSLSENQLTERPDDFSAQMHTISSLDKEALIVRMLNRGTALTRTDILAVMNGIEETVSEALHEGYSLNLPLFNTSFSISGVFEGPMDSFDGNRHKLNINLTKLVTSGGVVEIRGYNLKIEGDDPSCGLWFIHSNGTDYKASVIIENKPSKIIAMIPNMPDGIGLCQLKLVTQFSGSSKWLKTPKQFVYPKNLDVGK